MKTCPICKARCFDDMDICYGCMYHFKSSQGPDTSTQPNKVNEEGGAGSKKENALGNGAEQLFDFVEDDPFDKKDAPDPPASLEFTEDPSLEALRAPSSGVLKERQDSRAFGPSHSLGEYPDGGFQAKYQLVISLKPLP